MLLNSGHSLGSKVLDLLQIELIRNKRKRKLAAGYDDELCERDVPFPWERGLPARPSCVAGGNSATFHFTRHGRAAYLSVMAVVTPHLLRGQPGHPCSVTAALTCKAAKSFSRADTRPLGGRVKSPAMTNII